MALISADTTQSAAHATPMADPRQRRHLDHLDGLRALAAVFVVMHHAWLEVWPIVCSRFPTGVLLSLTAWMMYGHFAVTVFIVISGFCLALPVVRSGGIMPGGVRQFLKRRAWRILPPYYTAVAFSLPGDRPCIPWLTTRGCMALSPCRLLAQGRAWVCAVVGQVPYSLPPRRDAPLHESGWGRADRSRTVHPVWLLSAPSPQPFPAGGEHLPASAGGVSKIVWQYLVHPFRLDDGRTFGLLVVTSVPLIVGCSWLFYRTFERPCIKIGHATSTMDLAATHL